MQNLQKPLLLNLFFSLTLVTMLSCQNKKQSETADTSKETDVIKKIDISSPEALGKAYIDFINNGMKYSDYKLLMTTPDEVYSIMLIAEEHRADEFKQESVRMQATVAKMWNEDAKFKLVKNQITSMLPFKFISLRTKEKETEVWYEDNYILVSDKSGGQHVFFLEYICKVDNSWKINLPYVPPIELRELSKWERIKK